MTKKLTWKITTIVLFIVAMFLLLTSITLTGTTRASAAEDSETAIAVDAGWYMVGNGAGSLKDCSWTEYLPSFRLTGWSDDESDASYQNYLGTWKTEPLLLYENDQFKFLYADGTWEYPNDSGWSADITGDFSDLLEGQGTYFLDGGLSSIQVNTWYSGYYTFTVDVYTDAIEISFTLDSTDVPPIDLYEMYVVGTIKDLPSLGWPGWVPNSSLVKMTARSVEADGEVVVKYYSPVLYLHTTDEIKVWNGVNNLYCPSGVDNNFSPEEDGYYLIEWKQDAPDFIAILVEDPENPPIPPEVPLPPTPPTPAYPSAGWYIVGNGAGTLYDCSWSQYLSSYKLEGDAFDGVNSYKDYLGIWHTDSLLLYKGDQFKFLYANGSWDYTDESGWRDSLVGDFSNLADNVSGGAFSAVGQEKIQVNVSGYYTFYVHVAKSSDGIAITLTYHRESTSVPQKDLFDMYIVGTIASVPACGWPSDVNVASNCIKMSLNAYDSKWYSPAVYLRTTDSFKVYNLVNKGYYPSSDGGNVSPVKNGWYIIQWTELSQTLTLIEVPE